MRWWYGFQGEYTSVSVLGEKSRSIEADVKVVGPLVPATRSAQGKPLARVYRVCVCMVYAVCVCVLR